MPRHHSHVNDKLHDTSLIRYVLQASRKNREHLYTEAEISRQPEAIHYTGSSFYINNGLLLRTINREFRQPAIILCMDSAFCNHVHVGQTNKKAWLSFSRNVAWRKPYQMFSFRKPNKGKKAMKKHVIAESWLTHQFRRWHDSSMFETSGRKQVAVVIQTRRESLGCYQSERSGHNMCKAS